MRAKNNLRVSGRLGRLLDRRHKNECGEAVAVASWTAAVQNLAVLGASVVNPDDFSVMNTPTRKDTYV